MTPYPNTVTNGAFFTCQSDHLYSVDCQASGMDALSTQGGDFMTQYYDLVMAETLSRYAKDTLDETGLELKGIAPVGATESERWTAAKAAFYRQPIAVITEWGLIDFDPESQKTLSGGETLSYDDYLDLAKNSGHSVRHDFEKAYYDASYCVFKGRVGRIDAKRDTVCFERIYIDADYVNGGGDGFFGKEDHVWMDFTKFPSCKKGDCFAFTADIYRYIKTGHGKLIDFGLRDPECIRRIDAYELPSDEDLRLQSVNEIICSDLCMYREQCNGFCIANQEWRDSLRSALLR